jgi:beta-galactosidase/beta-glucuronidase
MRFADDVFFLTMTLIPLLSEELDAYGRGYPRPQLRRSGWYSLNGDWDFALDPTGEWTTPGDVAWDRRIRVPFSPETQASGIAEAGFYRRCWYRCRVDAPSVTDHRRLFLRFGAVDYQAAVWVNGTCVGEHEGGYTPFAFDITAQVHDTQQCEIVVRADDDPQDVAKPRGKQDWQVRPHSIWYPRTTGIWQTVWMEVVPATCVTALSFTPNLARWEIGIAATVDGNGVGLSRLAVTFTSRGMLLARDTYTLIAGEAHRRIALSDPGIDDSRNELLWSPDSPNLIDVQIELLDEDDTVHDAFASYTALRSADAQGDRFVLNNRPYVLRMVLDQGYWEGGGATAPNDAAFRRDIELVKQMGFNGVRKHQKIEDPRYLYWADRMGLAVWEEMPSAYRFTRQSVERLIRQWTAVLARDYSHPCVIAWVPINESWGVPNLPDSPSERHYVQALYHVTRTLDSTRPVIGNDGWESVATDIIGIHDYDDRPERIAARYHAQELLPRMFKRERPGGRILVLEGQKHFDQPLILTEFGGLALSRPGDGTWGYTRCNTAEDFARRYRELLDVVRELHVFSGFCYTQFADTYQEANGLLYADRTPKIPIQEIAKATRGAAARTGGLEQLTPAENQ